jgi:asparagine synthase (glutamine-hydrolysing)
VSGFFGVVCSNGAPVPGELLNRIARALEFRGPDGTQIASRDGVGFCFTFLDTKTRFQAVQPIRLGERFTLVGNVRLDARAELIANLEAQGVRAEAGVSDAELLILVWSLCGQQTLLGIAGDFSFALWDAHEQTLHGARDFVGARPFYYLQAPGMLCFSNTLQVLSTVPGFSRDFDDRFVRDFLLQGSTGDPERTVWRSIRRLPAGHSLKFSNGRLQVQRFLQLPIEEPLRLTRHEEYLEQFRELMRHAVKDRMPQGKLSLYLSGGLDSSAVSAFAADVASHPERLQELRAFTVGWRPLMEDAEPVLAELTATHLGLTHEILEEEGMIPDQDGNRPTTPEPTAELFLGEACRVYRAVAAHARVVLGGDGGDDVLVGQAWPYLRYLAKRGAWGEIIGRWGAYVVAQGQFPPMRGGFRLGLRRWLGYNDLPRHSPCWLRPDLEKRIGAETNPVIRLGGETTIHPIHPQAYRSLHSGYWASVLEEEDAGWTGVLLETRAPFLDLRVLRFLLRLPPVPWCMHKRLTRQAMKQQLPPRILGRKKAPLPRDPLEVCQKNHSWRLQLPQNAPEVFHQFVKWKTWIATLENSQGSLSRQNLYPLSLLYWLKDVEKQGGIQ